MKRVAFEFFAAIIHPFFCISFSLPSPCFQLGTMLSAEEAAKIGLVDDVVAPELVFDKSVEVALKFAALPRDARHKSKVITTSRSSA